MISTISNTPTQLLISWTPPDLNGIITGYSVYCNTSADQAYPEQVIGSNEPTIISVVNETTLDVTLTGLNPYTQYSCYVTANISVGEGSPSEIVSNITGESGELSWSRKCITRQATNYLSIIVTIIGGGGGWGVGVGWERLLEIFNTKHPCY